MKCYRDVNTSMLDNNSKFIYVNTLIVAMEDGMNDEIRMISPTTLNQDQFEELPRFSAGNLHISTPSDTTII